MKDAFDRRAFLGAATAATGMMGLHALKSTRADDEPARRDPNATTAEKPFLTDAGAFVDVSRGNPKPFTLKGEALEQARLTPATWRLEIAGDESAKVAQPRRLEDGTALDLEMLRDLGKTHGVTFLKAMQCNNIPTPLGQGLWEGVPLRAVVRLLGKVTNVRRLYYWGFHNNDPAQRFQSSLGFNQVMETPPGDLPPLIAYRLNGADIPLLRGGPVRMIVPWAHGFKSVKWLQNIVLTNDYKANDTYALQNNDPDSYLKTAAYVDRASQTFRGGDSIYLEGVAMSGWSGLKRVEYWLRPGTRTTLPEDDPAWETAVWRACELMPEPADWGRLLPSGTRPQAILGFDQKLGKPKDWPLRYSIVSWSVTLNNLATGAYEFRVRAVDANDFAQPEPRPYLKSGMNPIQCKPIVISA